jgi:hypothetical protein
MRTHWSSTRCIRPNVQWSGCFCSVGLDAQERGLYSVGLAALDPSYNSHAGGRSIAFVLGSQKRWNAGSCYRRSLVARVDHTNERGRALSLPKSRLPRGDARP